MESFNTILSWLNANETALSALAALVVIFGVFLSPLGAGIRGLLDRKQTGSANGKPASDNPDAPAQRGSEHGAGVLKNNETFSVSPALNNDALTKDRPVVAVLPFNNMSADADQGYLAEGMTEDVITALARSPDLDVIARNSTFVYKGTTPDIRQVGKDLGARYVVEGSLRAVGERIRVTVQLIDAPTGKHTWAENYDRPQSDIFTIQDEVSSGIASALGYAITVAEIDAANRASTDNLDAWGLVARSLSAAFQFNRETSAESVDYARQAVALDPDYAAAHARLASALIRRPVNGFSKDPEQEIAEANQAINRAMQLAPNDGGVLAEYGHVLLFSGRSAEAVPVLERSLALCPSNAIAIATYGAALCFTGDHEKGLAELTRAESLLPKAQYLYRIYFWRGLVYWGLEDFAGGEADLRRSLAIYRGFHTIWFVLAISLVQQNKSQEAAAALTETLRLQPDMSHPAGIKGLSVIYSEGIPKPIRDGMDKLEMIWPGP